MTRVANFAQHERNLAHILDAQKRINEGQLQIASGRKSEKYAGISRDARRLVTVEMSHARTTQYMENNKKIDQRLQTMEINLGQIFDVLTEYKTLMVNALNANNSADLALPTQAQAMLDQVTALLNVQEEGRYLFSGSRTTTAAVKQSTLPASYTIPTNDGDASAYFQGDSLKFTVRADQTFDLTYGVTADEQGFERAIRALHMVVIGTPGDRATMEDALKVTNQAIDDIADVRTRVGATRATLSRVNQMQEDFLLFTEKTISDVENVDITKVITNMNADQVGVEASFMAISRLSQLSLVNFLRR